MEPLFHALKHQWGLKDAWQQSRRTLIRWVTILSAGYALNQILADSDPARIGDLARPAPWRRKGEISAGLIRTGLDRILRQVGVTGISPRSRNKSTPPPCRSDARPTPRRSPPHKSSHNPPTSSATPGRTSPATTQPGYKLQFS